MSLNTTPRTWVAGEVVTAAFMNTEIRDAFTGIQAAWSAYTPTWTATTTNPVLNNGTLVGKWDRRGKTAMFRIVITMGTTTTYGSGVWQLTLPTAPLTSTERLTFTTLYYDSGVAEYSGRADWTGSVLNMLADPTTAGNALRGAGATIPFAWGSADQCIIRGEYEAA